KENEIFQKLTKTIDGRALIEEDLKLLTKNVGTKDIEIWENKRGTETYVRYLSAFDLDNSTTKEQKIFNDFNERANIFTDMPYEWGQERKGKNKRRYAVAKASYEKERNKVLEIKASRETPENKAK